MVWGTLNKVRTSRSEGQRREFGNYYSVRNNFIVAAHIDLQAWGRELEVLHDREVVS